MEARGPKCNIRKHGAHKNQGSRDSHAPGCAKLGFARPGRATLWRGFLDPRSTDGLFLTGRSSQFLSSRVFGDRFGSGTLQFRGETKPKRERSTPLS